MLWQNREESTMYLGDRFFEMSGRGGVINLYPIGDTQIGAYHCAEGALRKFVKHIADDPDGFWVGGGDLIDAIKPSDFRNDINTLPDWMFTGDASTIKQRMNDICQQQVQRVVEILAPIAPKCLGLVSGNHEDLVRKKYNHDYHNDIVAGLRSCCETKAQQKNIVDMTDASVLRFRCSRKKSSSKSTITVFVCHGAGGGRTPGAEPNHLDKLIKNKDFDLILRGHSHSYCQMPPSIVLSVNKQGKLKDELTFSMKRSANWGCWLRTWAAGPATYDSRACYDAKPIIGLKCRLQPFREIDGNNVPWITFEEIPV